MVWQWVWPWTNPSTVQNSVGANLGFGYLGAVYVEESQEFCCEQLWCGAGCEVRLTFEHDAVGGRQHAGEPLHRRRDGLPGVRTLHQQGGNGDIGPAID